MRMRLIPSSLAGRIAALMLLTLVGAQAVTIILFAGEREASFRSSFRDEAIARFVSLVELVEDSPPDIRERLLRATSTRGYRARIEPQPAARTDGALEAELASALSEALRKPGADVAVEIRAHGAAPEPPPPPRAEPPRSRPERPSWVTISVRLPEGGWLNVWVDRPPVPPLRRAFMASLFMSALAMVIVGAAGVALASRPLRRLAEAADRLGRGEDFPPLAETGPRETRQANIAFNRMRERLDRFVNDRTAMLAAIAHDLRTPITSLRLRAEFVDDEEARGKILETLAEMQAMTDAVLAFARGDAASEESRQTDLAALAESIVEDLAAAGRSVGMAESAAFPVRCRPVALRRALTNLIDNAARSTARAPPCASSEAPSSRG